MKLHPRTAQCRKADIQFSNCVNDLIIEYQLTEAEVLSIISHWVSGELKMLIRAERAEAADKEEMNAKKDTIS